MADAGQVKTDELDPQAEARRRLALAQIRQYPDPVLRMQANDVETFDGELARLVERMARLMADANGVGLAATQVGVLRRLFVFRPDREGESEPRAIVNPEIVARSDETEVDDEGCLSLQGVLVPVERHLRVTLEGRDEQGEQVRLELENLGARLGPDLDLEADVVVVVAYGLLIPDALLERALWLNVHPSLLPRWRGAAPVERAIMAGDRETGVTIHRTVAELDAGPIAAQRAFPIEPDDDAGSVYERSARVAVELLREALPEPTFVPQPEEGVTYAEKITAADRELDWSRPAEEALNRIRALSPHIGARGELQGRPVIVWRARIDDGELRPLEVQPEGRRRMTYEEFLRGLR